MERTIERITADLQHAGIDPKGYGQRIGESLADFTQRLIDTTGPIDVDLQSIIDADIANNWPHCAVEVGR